MKKIKRKMSNKILTSNYLRKICREIRTRLFRGISDQTTELTIIISHDELAYYLENKDTPKTVIAKNILERKKK